jgi:hypothetical protein
MPNLGDLVPISGIGTLMTFFSADDDFVSRTLAAIPGRVARLLYLAGLRNNAGQYEHWGLTRTHGELPAQKAIAKAHTDAFLSVLRTPLAKLAADYRDFLAEDQERGAADLLQNAVELVPQDLSGGGSKHFNLIVGVLCSLEKTHPRDKRRAA